MVYKLRSVLRGHELDVRAVASSNYPEGSVLTASRDQQCKLWVPEESKNFTDSKTFLGHTKYVSAICSVPPSDKYPQGKSILCNVKIPRTNALYNAYELYFTVVDLARLLINAL